jgi:hypothetical protein
MKTLIAILLLTASISHAGIKKTVRHTAATIGRTAARIVTAPIKGGVRAVDFLVKGTEYWWGSCTDPTDPDKGISFFRREHGPCVAYYDTIRYESGRDVERARTAVQAVSNWDSRYVGYRGLCWTLAESLDVMGPRLGYPGTAIVHYSAEMAKTGDAGLAVTIDYTGAPLQQVPAFPVVKTSGCPGDPPPGPLVPR